MMNRTLARGGLRLRAHLAAWTLIASAPLAHAAGAPDPGDYVPAPDGTTVVALYAQHLRGDRARQDGETVASDLNLRFDATVARFMHYGSLAGQPADVELIVPWGRQRLGDGAERLSGVGNVSIGATWWPLADAERGEYLGVASYLSLPTGAHRDEGLFVSEDRAAWDVEAGYVKPLGGPWTLDLVGQVEAYQRDRSTEIARRPMLRAFAHLSYALSDATRFALSLRQTWGAREHLDGETVTGAHADTNLMLTWQQQIGETLQLQVQAARDVRVRSGVPLDALQLRLVAAF